MATPESKVKAKVKKVLAAHGAYWHCPVQSAYGAPSLDFIGCHRVLITPDMVGLEVGLYYGIETKAANKTPTKRQAGTMAAIEHAGGKTFLINEETGMTELEEWLK